MEAEAGHSDSLSGLQLEKRTTRNGHSGTPCCVSKHTTLSYTFGEKGTVLPSLAFQQQQQMALKLLTVPPTQVYGVMLRASTVYRYAVSLPLRLPCYSGM